MRDMARGIDPRPVEPESERKSVGAETTFARDLPDGPELRAALREIARHVDERLHHSGVRAGTIALKLRYSYFKTITRQASVKPPIDDADSIAALAGKLLDAVVEPGDHFRLLGISGTRLSEAGTQSALWSDAATVSAEEA
jgi:DNA polymerase-4